MSDMKSEAGEKGLRPGIQSKRETGLRHGI